MAHLDPLPAVLLAVGDLDLLCRRKTGVLLEGDLLGFFGPLASRLLGLGLPLGLLLGLPNLLLPQLGHLLQLGLGNRLVKLAYSSKQSNNCLLRQKALKIATLALLNF